MAARVVKVEAAQGGDRWRSFVSRVPAVYAVSRDGEIVGRVWSYRDPSFPAANVTRWGVSVDGETATFSYLRQVREWVAKR